jgi:hypothetical protein
MMMLCVLLLGEAPHCGEPPVQRPWLVEGLLLKQQWSVIPALLQLFAEGLCDALRAALQAW